MQKLSKNQREALELTAKGTSLIFGGYVHESTLSALTNRKYARVPKKFVNYYAREMTREGAEAIGLNFDELLIAQAERRVQVMQASLERVLTACQQTAYQLYDLNDVNEAYDRVQTAKFELAALQCAVRV